MSLQMELKRCMNTSCATFTSIQWRKGWTLRSGAPALLCESCGSSYEQSNFCNVFHEKQDGWRPCCLCGKKLHCGCIASRPLIVLRDSGGIFCLTCSKNSGQVPEMTCSENLIGDTPPSNACIAGLTQEEIRRQTSGVPNSTIVLLFEKKLTPSDVGRQRRVVIPKRYAKAYFPPICEAESIDLPIHDEIGRKWVFKFRCYASNDFKMYVFEGVRPWTDFTQVQAGDTIIFSRMDPEMKYIIGFRKTPFSSAQQPPIRRKKSKLIKRKKEQDLVSSRKKNLMEMNSTAKLFLG